MQADRDRIETSRLFRGLALDWTFGGYRSIRAVRTLGVCLPMLRLARSS
jgi:hypothetical protein